MFMILATFRRRRNTHVIQVLYGAIVAQARLRVFYMLYGVEDTVDGRFELIVLHLVLLIRRLARPETQNAGAQRTFDPALGQPLFDAFCRDLDDNLREMGVGDLAVPRKMRSFGEAFYGRQAAYEAALVAADERELEKALARNIFGLADVDERAAQLARYARAAATQLDAVPEDMLLTGRALFPGPEAFAHG
jgi:cytochrome b pre-mRNA-processing protein 3